MNISDLQRPLGTAYGPKTEAREVLAGKDLSGLTALVTGGYSGLGLETARALAGAGARVIAAGRSPAKARDALAGVPGALEFIEIDLGDLASVRRAAAEIAIAAPALDMLVCNAAIMACPETRIGQGWEAQFATNHLGHFALTRLLEANLAAAAETHGWARVVSLSSVGHKRSPIRFDDIHFRKEPYEKWTAYGQAKTANALFAVALDARLKDRGVRAFAVHPGGILTPLQRHLQKEEMIALGWIDDSGGVSAMAAPFFKSPAAGAATTVWCATSSDLEGIGGVYCEDCDIAIVGDAQSPRASHVFPHAVDREAAVRLWHASEEMVASA